MQSGQGIGALGAVLVGIIVVFNEPKGVGIRRFYFGWNYRLEGHFF